MTNSVPITPGPNVNKPRVQRPQDAAYQTAVKTILEKENEGKGDGTMKDEKDVLKIFTHLANALNETSKTDVNLPPKFYGDDDKWEARYKQWRAYLQAKEWLTTAEHPEGPGADNFNLKVNAKIYNALINLCQKGKAIAYIEQAAEFDGRGALQQLLFRYDGFSKQKLHTLKKCVENIKHISGTNITHHIDRFEKICGQMVSCGFIPEEEQKIDWFLASVQERTYDAMHAHCINLMLQGTLTFGQLVKLYTHQCFSRYPHFQVDDLDKGNKYTNNSVQFRGKGKKGQHQTFNKNQQGYYPTSEKGKGKGRSNGNYKRDYQGRQRNDHNNGTPRGFTQNSSQYKGKGKGKGKYERGKGKGRGKGKDNRGERKETTDETTKSTNNSQRVYLEPPLNEGDDETTIIFTQNMNGMTTNTRLEEQQNDDTIETENNKEGESQDSDEPREVQRVPSDGRTPCLGDDSDGIPQTVKPPTHPQNTYH